LPWVSFDKTLSLIKIFIKLVISIGFVFDKAGRYRWQVNLACFAIQTYIVVLRYHSAIIFNDSVLYATTFYEAAAMWLYIVIALHIMSGTAISTITLMLITFGAIIFGSIMVSL
jgi:hypothetical protein